MGETAHLTIATFNLGKLTEYRRMLLGTSIDLSGLADFANISEVDENGATFGENARLKASGYAVQTGTQTLADDSGLVVDALGGRPGVLSARYGGKDTDFGHKMAFLLREMEESGSSDRRARFVCEIALAEKDGTIRFTASGICEGMIASAPRGAGGFGYDPIFIPNGFRHTFGELSSEVKDEISHRAGAFSQIIPYLRDNIAV